MQCKEVTLQPVWPGDDLVMFSGRHHIHSTLEGYVEAYRFGYLFGDTTNYEKNLLEIIKVFEWKEY